MSNILRLRSGITFFPRSSDGGPDYSPRGGVFVCLLAAKHTSGPLGISRVCSFCLCPFFFFLKAMYFFLNAMILIVFMYKYLYLRKIVHFEHFEHFVYLFNLEHLFNFVFFTLFTHFFNFVHFEQ